MGEMLRPIPFMSLSVFCSIQLRFAKIELLAERRCDLNRSEE
jgi:hypothetical protein